MPVSFPAVRRAYDIDVAVVLNLIGVLTTPPLSGGASLSELWAFVRYLFATTGDSDLRLTADFQSMDPHQKTILSDDFGMGFTMHWLTQNLNLVAACDGRYFIENHLTNFGGVYTGGAAKRGLGKSPDFVALDRLGMFHVIECKGTQSSKSYRNSQLSSRGVSQKSTIQFPQHLRGEKIAAGIFVAGPDGDESEIRIIDPDPPERYVINEDRPELALSALSRGAIAKQLRSAGLPFLASAVAFPSVRPNLTDAKSPIENLDQAFQRREQGRVEASQIRGRGFNVGGDDFVGRRAVLDLPRPLETKRGSYTQIEIRQGVARENFEGFASDSMYEDVLPKTQSERIVGQYNFGERNGRAWIRLGSNYYSDLRLLK